MSTLARCAVASRMLPPSEFSITQPRLQQLAEHALLVALLDVSGFASVDVVEGLLILGTWSTAVGPLAPEVHLGPAIDAAIQIARELQFDQASRRAFELRSKARQSGMFGLLEDKLYEEEMYKARLVHVLSVVAKDFVTHKSNHSG
jgi:hypothetical protein